MIEPHHLLRRNSSSMELNGDDTSQWVDNSLLDSLTFGELGDEGGDDGLTPVVVELDVRSREDDEQAIEVEGLSMCCCL
ncbi:unnamed protein product [Cuscuta europaea]|uniref:Uncharacterized protein n=1 Tax=Cuscuta europaea TaxID=41803 RepID=A0A9P0ZHA9_CUSEU|nr:unnamed protein product [Cuscuta europaea]